MAQIHHDRARDRSNDFTGTMERIQKKLSLDEHIINKNIEERAFTTFESLKSVLTATKLTRLLEIRRQSKWEKHECTDVQPIVRMICGMEVDSYDSGGGSLRVVATMIYGSMRVELEKHLDLWKEFWVQKKRGNLLLDHMLPLKEDQAKEHFGNYGANAFRNCQRRFSVLILRASATPLQQEMPMMPFVGDFETLGTGQSGTVRAVKIAKGHWVPSEGVQSSEVTELAQKVFHESKQFEDERTILDEVRRARISNQLVVVHFLSLEIGQECSLLFEKAGGSLQQFLFERPENKSLTASSGNCLAFVERARDLVSALIHLHKARIFHMDIHPRNILIFVSRGQNIWNLGDDGNIWKLADFDRAMMREGSAERSLAAMYKDFLTATSLSVVKCEERPGTFMPPEAHEEDQQKREYGEQSDTWSMACVLVMIFTYMCGGDGAVGDFIKGLTDEHKEQKTVAEFLLPSVSRRQGIRPW